MAAPHIREQTEFSEVGGNLDLVAAPRSGEKIDFLQLEEIQI